LAGQGRYACSDLLLKKIVEAFMTTFIRFEYRDPEDRTVAPGDPAAIREKMFDKTLADSYPASDPPSTLPDPSVDSVCSLKPLGPLARRAA
jgi:hypothetical protein